MRRFLKKLIKIVGYSLAAVTILLAIVVGLFRLFLPRLPEYQDQIKAWAGDAIGMRVEFSGMNARWGLSGPELEFYDAELIRPDNEIRVVAADRVGIGVDAGKLLFDRAFVVDYVAIRETSIEVRQLEGGGWWVQGMALEDLPLGESGSGDFDDVTLIGEDIVVQFLQPEDVRPHVFRVPRAQVKLDERRLALDANVRLPEELGRVVNVSATQLLDLPVEERNWDVTVDGDGLSLAGWAHLHPVSRQLLVTGEGDIEVSMVVAGRSVRRATAGIDLFEVRLVDGEEFEVGGRVEFERSSQGWLVVAEDLVIAGADHAWPASSLHAEAGTDAEGRIEMLDLRASYLNLGDSRLLLPLLPEDRRDQLLALSPSGEIRGLGVTVSGLEGETPAFRVEAELDNVGIAADGKRPGVRGFTGHINGDRTGGRLELRSRNMLVEMPEVMPEAVDIAVASGTLLWRQSGERTTILSDGIDIANPVFDSRSSFELGLDAGGGAPYIDLTMTYRVGDVGSVPRYLPRNVMKEKTYDWFERALVAGSVDRGTVRLRGPLDKFPFDDGEGRFLLEGTTRNLTLLYGRRWPAAEQVDMDIVLDGMRLYSVRNRSSHVGNIAVDANIEIADLRNPVLTIDGLASGTLESLRQFATQSPINRFTGGNLERLSMAGDASFNIDLTVPLRDAKSATVDGVLRSNNGTVKIAGLSAPLTDLIGEIRITRDAITADSLGARFLGEDVDLRVAPGDDPQYFAVATAVGAATATGLVEELGVPLEGLIEGQAGYEARILFPRGGEAERPPFTVRVTSSLQGLAFDLPAPLGKTADEERSLRGDVRFLAGGERIESGGIVGDDIAWLIEFARPEGSWDFDRGVVMAGGGEIETADTRGLHLRGRADTIRLDDWLGLSTSRKDASGAASRIRSVDLLVDNFFAIGQHLEGHRVRVDRSARDWLVQLEGEAVTGSVFVPYDFGSDRAMVIEMDRMHLPGDETSTASESELDPRALPPIRLQAKDFAMGERYLGEVNVSLVRIDGGLATETLSARDNAFSIDGEGRWIVDETAPLGSRTNVSATLTSNDVRTAMSRLNFAQGVSGSAMSVELDVGWGGGPRADFLDSLDGEVRMRLENGELEEVEPGAGRMLGLVSFVALPRRLSLDFRDVFGKGFRYDNIAGTFAIDDGIASTCDLSLEGPAANVGIVGQVDLVASEYEQGAVVSAHVGDTLPLVGAVVGGPPGAAAAFIFSQIFREPLSEVSQVFYGMSGSWDDPVIESVSSDDFVHYGQLAGCLAESEQE
jgi:uncharacterized protein (TIGR02099 family)